MGVVRRGGKAAFGVRCWWLAFYPSGRLCCGFLVLLEFARSHAAALHVHTPVLLLFLLLLLLLLVHVIFVQLRLHRNTYNKEQLHKGNGGSTSEGSQVVSGNVKKAKGGRAELGMDPKKMR